MIRLVIDDKEFSGFTVNNISLMYNAICSTFSFSGLSDFCPAPFSYPVIKVYFDQTLLFTGTVLNISYISNAKPQLASISGYSKAGILEDCTIPESAMPMQLDNLSLKQICEKLLPLFGLKFTYEKVVSYKINKKIAKVNFDYDKSIKSVIVDLATEKGIFVNHINVYYDNIGDIHFTDSSTDNLTPEYTYKDDNTINMTLSYNGQDMHSEITVLGQTKKDEKYNSQTTIRNPYVDKKIVRPIIYTMKNGESDGVKDSARLRLSSELRSMSLKIETREFVRPGILVNVTSTKLRLFKETSWFVEQVDISADAKGMKYTLSCVLKDVFSVKPVKSIFE